MNLSDKREKVNESANILLNLLNQRYGGDKLMKYFIGILDVKEDIIVLAAALEVLSHQLIKSTDDYFKEKTNIKKIVKRLGRIISEYSGNKTITMPTLGSLLALRDLDTGRTIKAIMNLPDKQLEIVRYLSDSYAPDLASNLSTQSSSDYGQPSNTSNYNYVCTEKRSPPTIVNNLKDAKPKATPFFHEYDQVMTENEPQSYSYEGTSKGLEGIGVPDTKSVYSTQEIDIIVDSIKSNIDARIECLNHIQKFIQL